MQQSEQCEGLQQRINEYKSSLGSAQMEERQWMAQYDSLMEKHQGLDLTMTKLDNHCEVSRAGRQQGGLGDITLFYFPPA